MQQILFHVPFTSGWFPPDGIPLHGFGAMLFYCFVITAMVWGPRRAQQIGLPKERLQDMAILLFVTGIAGARLVYMIQYADQFRDKNLLVEFFKIWEGGIVFYGSVFGGLVGFLAFRHFVLKKLGVSTFKLLDAVAPLIAFGLAVGRIGCYLNGCCWGQVAVPESEPVPLSAELGKYPLLSAHGVREQVTTPANSGTQLPQVWGLQTAVGFTTEEQPTVVHGLERGSEAAKVLRVGDRVLRVNGSPVYQLSVRGLLTEEVPTLRGELLHQAAEDLGSYDDGFVLGYTSITEVSAAEERVRSALRRESRADKPKVSVRNSLDAASWPRWQKSLDLEVDRDGKKVSVSFTPRTVSVFPTQLYETVSMGLLTVFLLAFQPFRRHDGQLMVLLMLGYGVHRWFNEAIRIEPTYAMGMTLSQWISLAIIASGVVLELYLRKGQPRLPQGPLPLSHGAPVVVPFTSSSDVLGLGRAALFGVFTGAIAGYRGSYLNILPWAGWGLLIGFGIGVIIGAAGRSRLKSIRKTLQNSVIFGLNYSLICLQIASLVGSIFVEGDATRGGLVSAIVCAVEATIAFSLSRMILWPLFGSIAADVRSVSSSNG